MANLWASLRGQLWPTLLLVILAAAPIFAQDDITVFTSPQKNVPEWAGPNALTLSITPLPGTTFTVIPLTASLGLNGTGTVRTSINIEGHLKAANVSSYNDLSGNGTIAYLSCDKPASDGFIDPDKMLNRLMKASLKAIVLYTTEQNICLISSEGTLPYTSILSMADSGEAARVLSYLNGNQSVANVDARIYGTTGQTNTNVGSNGPGGNNSAVAMSILYSITGIITLLFIIIIATGAIRAHRYPERYGPRRGLGGRPRQSRAKGLARAVLDTIPIVKFGNQQPTKPDPELELEGASAEGHEAGTQRATTTNTNESEVPVAKTAAAAAAALEDERNSSEEHASRPSSEARSTEPVKEPAEEPAKEPATASSIEPATAPTTSSDATHGEGDDDEGQEHPSCSICTEDFTVGEDVRVLPCNHQFHPHCVDPWLVNVSGTCPLCRLDLRPARQGSTDQPSVPDEHLAPPLVLEGGDGDSTHAAHGNRLSRLLDVNRLRQAGVEERIAALRQMRAHHTMNQPTHEQEQEQEPQPQQQHPQESQQSQETQATPATQESDTTERPHAARLTDRLKDKFRIRTRSQRANQ